jgi:tRNA(Phe) wybutosine-synthesizing methylase Tyw3
MSLVTQQKFDELVKNTTSYLQDVFKRLDQLEEKIDALAQPPRTQRSRKEDSSE